MTARKTDPRHEACSLLLLLQRASSYQTKQKEADVSEEAEGKLGAERNGLNCHPIQRKPGRNPHRISRHYACQLHGNLRKQCFPASLMDLTFPRGANTLPVSHTCSKDTASRKTAKTKGSRLGQKYKQCYLSGLSERLIRKSLIHTEVRVRDRAAAGRLRGFLTLSRRKFIFGHSCKFGNALWRITICRADYTNSFISLVLSL